MDSVCNNGCLPGFYSLTCTQSCGKCGGNGSCNRQSRFCDESSCLPRYFGPLCIQLCPLNCGGDGSCDFQTANCLQGCKSRFSGTRCELFVACPSSTCRDPCQAINGGICTSGCRSGYFGDICNRVCNCQNNGACVQDTGVCESISQTTSVTVPTSKSSYLFSYRYLVNIYSFILLLKLWNVINHSRDKVTGICYCLDSWNYRQTPL